MRKVVFTLLFLIMPIVCINAQEIGVRFGNVSAGHVAIDGVFSTSKLGRIHADISFGSGVGIDALWDFLYQPLGEEAFNLYLGAGAYTWIDDPFWLGVEAEAGLEYRFKGVPLALGFDWRPQLSIIETTDFHIDRFGLNVRLVFGKK